MRGSKLRTVGDVMNPAPPTTAPSAGLRDLVELFQTGYPAAVPVIDDEGQLSGIVTMLDLLRAYRAFMRLPPRGKRAFWSRTVETVMRPGVITVTPGDPLDKAADLMLETRYHSLPVVHRHGEVRELIGILEQRDLLSALAGRSVR